MNFFNNIQTIGNHHIIILDTRLYLLLMTANHLTLHSKNIYN